MGLPEQFPIRGGRAFRLAVLLALPFLHSGCSERAEQSPLSGGQLRLGSVLGETVLAGFARAEAPREFVFPADHGPHPAFRSEWWYLTLVLRDEAGWDVGVQFTLFRQALTPLPGELANRWQSNQVFLAHFALSDTASGMHSSDERFARGHPDLVGVEAAPFSLWLEDWRLEEVGDIWRLQADTAQARVEIDLDMAVPIILQGEAGLSRKGPGQASYYYSMPGTPAKGRIWVDGKPRTVGGLGWLDREWSTSVLSNGQLGWDWFALQLDDGRRLMAFQLRRQDGARDGFDQGMLVSADGSTRHLEAEDFTLTPRRYWSDGDGIDWPVAWKIGLADEVLEVVAVLDDQQMRTSIRYWEGMVAVLDEHGQAINRGEIE
jgi:predicted secreted hydrolase